MGARSWRYDIYGVLSRENGGVTFTFHLREVGISSVPTETSLSPLSAKHLRSLGPDRDHAPHTLVRKVIL